MIPPLIILVYSTHPHHQSYFLGPTFVVNIEFIFPSI